LPFSLSFEAGEIRSKFMLQQPDVSNTSWAFCFIMFMLLIAIFK